MQFLFRYCGPGKNGVTGFFSHFLFTIHAAFSVHGSDGLSVQCCNPRIYYYIVVVVVVVAAAAAATAAAAAAAAAAVVVVIVVIVIVTVWNLLLGYRFCIHKICGI
jgi:hypothetical protein